MFLATDYTDSFSHELHEFTRIERNHFTVKKQIPWVSIFIFSHELYKYFTNF
jgi:hypothetical protein